MRVFFYSTRSSDVGLFEEILGGLAVLNQ